MDENNSDEADLGLEESEINLVDPYRSHNILKKERFLK